jgi:hypothetical protein
MKPELNQLGIPGTCRCLMTLGNACHSLSWVTMLSPCKNMCYGPTRIGIQQRICNYILTRARQMVECALRILMNKRKILHRSFDAIPQFCDSKVKACCILHNFVLRNDGFHLEDNLY